jgi:hypothetical protein
MDVAARWTDDIRLDNGPLVQRDLPAEQEAGAAIRSSETVVPY